MVKNSEVDKRTQNLIDETRPFKNNRKVYQGHIQRKDFEFFRAGFSL